MTSINTVQRALKDGGASRASIHQITGLELQGSTGIAVVREERASDVARRERLLDAAFGEARFGKTSEILREGRAPARGLALAAHCDGELVGTVRLWHIDAGPGVPALLLGPLAVSVRHRTLGLGGLLMGEAIARAKALGHRAILLVGDEPYYRRFGFSAALTWALDLPGPVDRARFLALELESGALANARGLVRATGAMLQKAQPHLKAQLLAA